MDPAKINPELKEGIAKGWERPEHIRLRIQPAIHDSEYPVLGDLNEFIKRHGTTDKIRILDFGAGASPYKIYFPNADYRRADIIKTPGLDYEIDANSRIDEESETFDLIISTQVLEHVENTRAYLAESLRLLKKSGKLLVTTHGIWEEHGVPYDFQRWTEAGMMRDLKAVGFDGITIFKTTCGLRAGTFFFIKTLFAAKPPDRQPGRLFFKIFRTSISKIFPFIYRLSDKFWPEERIEQVTTNSPSSAFYAIIAATARKPNES